MVVVVVEYMMYVNVCVYMHVPKFAQNPKININSPQPQTNSWLFIGIYGTMYVVSTLHVNVWCGPCRGLIGVWTGLSFDGKYMTSCNVRRARFMHHRRLRHARARLRPHRLHRL